MAQQQPRFGETFEPVAYEQWRQLAERDLKGARFDKRLVSRTDDGIAIQPIYSPKDDLGPDAAGFPGTPPYLRGAHARVGDGWQIREVIDDPDLNAATDHARRASQRGAQSLWIQLDATARAGRDLDHVGDLPASTTSGVMLGTTDQMQQLLVQIELPQTTLALDAGASALPAAALLFAAARSRGIGTAKLRGHLDCDPLGTLAADGRIPMPLERAYAQMADLVSWLVEHAPGLRGITISTLAYHNAGATEAQELAFALATGAEYLRKLTDQSIDVERVCQQLFFRFAAGRDVFLQIAKLRAARLTWARLVQACGGSAEAQRMHMHVCTARRTKTARDPWVNMLRATVETFAAATGGADVITTSTFDDAFGVSDAFAQRIARNTQTMLREESHVGRVLDPAGGSYYVEQLTRQLAEQAWTLLQQIEGEGGMARALQDGKVASRIDDAYHARAKAISKRKLALTGVSEFPNVHEEAPSRRAPDVAALRQTAQQALEKHLDQVDLDQVLTPLAQAAAAQGATAGSLTAAAIDGASAGATLGRIAALVNGATAATEMPALETRRDAEPFEALRDACDAWADIRGHRPRVFVASMGPIPQHRARSEFSSNLFQAGGFEPITSDGYDSIEAAATAFSKSGADLAVICSTDADYAERAVELAGALKAQRAKIVVLAGRPGDQEQRYREAGIGPFIYLGCDVHQTLRTLLDELGVTR